MRKLLLIPLAAALTTGTAALPGCATDYPVKRIESPVNVTHEVAFGDYRRVFNTAYHIVNRYGVVQRSSYRYGEITALVSEDTSMFDKTRRTIQARIFPTEDHYEVECNVLISVEDSEVASFPGQFQPRYSWKTIARDAPLEVRLNNEIRAALTGGAWEAKEPLTPKATVPLLAPPAPRKTPRKTVDPRQGTRSGDGSTGEVSNAPSGGVAQGDRPSPEAFERVGLERLRGGDHAGAARAFRAGLQAGEGQTPFGRYLLAQALYSDGEDAPALAAVRQGAQVNAEWVQADLDVRTLYDEPGVFEQRLRDLGDASRSDGELTLLLGYMRLHSGDAQGALAALDAYLADHGDDALALRYREAARARLDRAHGLEDF